MLITYINVGNISTDYVNNLYHIYKLTELKRGNTEAALRGCSLEMLFKKFEISQESISGENLQISVKLLDKCN